jgi:hypothetical protein
MTDERIRIACAEALGWKIEPCPQPGLRYVTTPIEETRFTNGHQGIPDYPNDLNAAECFGQKMHEAGWHVKITPHHCLWYVSASHRQHGDFEIENSSLPTALCEAFLRTIGKWEEL